MVCNIKGNGHNIMWPVFFLVKINCFIKALICVNKILGQYQGTIIYFIEILLTKCNSNIHGTVNKFKHIARDEIGLRIAMPQII